MKRLSKIRTQIIISMASVAVGNLVLLFLLYYIISSSLIDWLSPDLITIADDLAIDLDKRSEAASTLLARKPVLEFILVNSDFIAFAAATIIAIASSLWFGQRLARKIAAPIEAVTLSARKIARGELSARIEPKFPHYGEAEELIADFNEMAERLHKAEQELRYSSAAIAHELRTPLTIIRGQLQGLLDGVFEPTQEVLASMLQSAEDLSQIIGDLNFLGTTSEGGIRLNREPIDLADEAEKVIVKFSKELEQAGLVTSTAFAPTPTLADPTRVRQAITILLDNARHYAGPGEITIETFVENHNAILRYRDHGPGLPAGAEEKVFTRFWRSDSSRSRAKGGSGLGLAVLRAIARAHGGDATAKNASDQGAVFELILPTSPPV